MCGANCSLRSPTAGSDSIPEGTVTARRQRGAGETFPRCRPAPSCPAIQAGFPYRRAKRVAYRLRRRWQHPLLAILRFPPQGENRRLPDFGGGRGAPAEDGSCGSSHDRDPHAQERHRRLHVALLPGRTLGLAHRPERVVHGGKELAGCASFPRFDRSRSRSCRGCPGHAALGMRYVPRAGPAGPLRSARPASGDDRRWTSTGADEGARESGPCSLPSPWVGMKDESVRRTGELTLRLPRPVPGRRGRSGSKDGNWRSPADRGLSEDWTPSPLPWRQGAFPRPRLRQARALWQVTCRAVRPSARDMFPHDAARVSACRLLRHRVR